MICPNCKTSMKEASCNKSNVICSRCGLIMKDIIKPEAVKKILKNYNEILEAEKK